MTDARTGTLLDPALPPELHAATETLAAGLQRTAVARDAAGGHAAAERELIRASGLLHLTTPAEYGGQGVSWLPFFRVLRRLAQADSALAHVFAFHHLQIATILHYGSPAQHARLLPATVRENLFWGNALNPNDRRTLASEATDGGFLIDGPKSWCSGSVGSDRLTFSAWHAPSQSLLIGVTRSNATGVQIAGDWDAFGQRQTDSGTVTFDKVRVDAADVLVLPGTRLTAQATLRTQIAQLILASLYGGIARGAFDEAVQFTRERSRPWFASGVERAIDDPHVQTRCGELRVLIRPAELMLDEAAQLLDRAIAMGPDLTWDQRGEVAIAVAEAKAVAHAAATEVGARMFELTGASATSGRFGLDRFWRNARVHTLHDPLHYKLRDLGRHALEGRWPEPTSYS